MDADIMWYFFKTSFIITFTINYYFHGFRFIINYHFIITLILIIIILKCGTMSLADTQTKAGNDPALISVSAKDIDILETLTLGANLQSE